MPRKPIGDVSHAPVDVKGSIVYGEPKKFKGMVEYEQPKRYVGMASEKIFKPKPTKPIFQNRKKGK